MSAVPGQFLLIVDTINDAIRDTCRAIGPKQVALALWPTKKEEAAGRYLDDCLNPNNERKLAPEEVILIAKLGRERGIHLIAGYLMQDLGYTTPVPVDPEDVQAELQRQFHEDVTRLERLAKRIKTR